MLSPWFFGVCPRPVNRIRHVMHNYRTLASVMYLILTRIDHDLDKVEAEAARGPLRRRMSGILFDIESQALSRKSPKHRPAAVHPEPVTASGDKGKGTSTENVDVDQLLLSPRPIFEPLKELLLCLFPESHFAPVLEEMEPWLLIVQTELNDWLTRTTVSVLELKQKHNEGLSQSYSSVMFSKAMKDSQNPPALTNHDPGHV